ncbi:MAG: FumA C-terminus/TtdB family hydratase beta subunit [bacterium]
MLVYDEYHLRWPYKREIIQRLKAGDKVFITGPVYTARDAAHKRMMEDLSHLPFPLEDQIIYYCGPTPPKPGRPVGAAGPTTSRRMDAYTSQLLEGGLLGMIGKGPRSQEVIEAIVQYGAVYLTAIGGAGALLGKYITRAEIVAYPDLGCEAVYKFELVNFPVYVGVDSQGKTIFTNQ